MHDCPGIQLMLYKRRVQSCPTSLHAQLESAIAQVDTEIAAQVALKCGMEERLAKVQQKLDLNQGRLQVRGGAGSGCKSRLIV